MRNIIPALLFSLLISCSHSVSVKKILPENWDSYSAGDKVMDGLVKVTAPQVKGAHDAEFVCFDNKAYIITMVNDSMPGESPYWPFVYNTLSVIDLKTLHVQKIIPVSRGNQIFENDILPEGACFVPRIIQKDTKTLRCFFASEQPEIRQSQIWYLDFDVEKEAFIDRIYRMKFKTDEGVFDMQPQYFCEDSTIKPTAGFYLFDSFKNFDGETYVAVNNFMAKQNGLAKMNATLDTVELLGYYKDSKKFALSESSVNRLPDGTWMAICRNDGQQWDGTNYLFQESKDGKSWDFSNRFDFVVNGINAKPTFNKFNGIYYLGWQEKSQIDGKEIPRCLFNVDVSRDGKNWERKYSFKTDKSFQYPTFHEYNGSIWLSVTQGDIENGKKRIMFGKLE
ncbi:sialidase family protein [Maribellus maritimus]|uniref:sialidase family protein n=1 Tax=Maribellus maritimus TaxID=2870838 RepID=UPI001EEBD5A4|nr:sialidase family protein [Maribellus maritimus]MCG6190051.1 glycoside hydrolase [Maribellus maritimus]